MGRSELARYAQEYFPADYSDAAEQAWELRTEDPQAAAKTATQFYELMAENKAEDARAFDVQSVAQDHNVAIVSAIRTYGTLGPFRPLDAKAFKGVRLFDILLRPGQIVCGSSVVEGDSGANLYGNWGVIVGSGTVHQAFPYDAISSVSQGVVHSKFAARLEGMRPSEQLLHALHARRRYNEINASADSIAGIFYCQDDTYDPSNDRPSKELLDIIEPLGIPQYVLKNGLFYETSGLGPSPLDLTNPIPPSEIVKNTVTPSKDQADYMIDHLAQMLTVAPRNSITSGVARGQFSFDHMQIANVGPRNFLAQHEKLVAPDRSDSLRLYGAMALYAFAELAQTAGELDIAAEATSIAVKALRSVRYAEYKSRILPTGNLTITAGDLRYYLQHEALPPYLDH